MTSSMKILCPVDFSPGARQALRTAVRIANQRDAELILAHAWRLPPIPFGGESAYGDDMFEQLARGADTELQKVVGEAKELGARRVSSRLLTGPAWQRIVEAARQEPGVELIVIGTHGRTGLSRVLLGSVTEMVVRHAPCPILVIHPDEAPGPYRHVLCPIDLSTSAHEAMGLVPGLVEPDGLGVTLLHVFEPPAPYGGASRVSDVRRQIGTRTTELMDRWAAELESKVKVPVTQLTQIGRPGAQILALLDDDRTFDLVVMGSHGNTGLSRLLLGSVAEQVVRYARRPVLVAHGKGAIAS